VAILKKRGGEKKTRDGLCAETTAAKGGPAGSRPETLKRFGLEGKTEFLSVIPIWTRRKKSRGAEMGEGIGHM